MRRVEQNSSRKHVVKVCIEGGQLLIGQRMPYAEHLIVMDKATRVIVVIKPFNLLDCGLLRIQNLKEAEVFRIDKSLGQQFIGQKGMPTIPIVASRRLETDDRLRVAFAGLKQGQNLKAFILRAESPRK
jgi:hypothetical protein